MGDNRDDELGNVLWHSKSWGAKDKPTYGLSAEECSN